MLLHPTKHGGVMHCECSVPCQGCSIVVCSVAAHAKSSAFGSQQHHTVVLVPGDKVVTSVWLPKWFLTCQQDLCLMEYGTLKRREIQIGAIGK